jgi:hypothetical protein
VAVITSPDSVLSVTVNVVQDPEGIYAIQISAITPAGQAVAIEYGGNRIFEGPARTDSGEG